MSLFSLQAAPSVTAGLDRDTISVGESANFSLVFEGGAPARLPQVNPPPGVRMQYAGQSSQYVMSNGQTRSTLTHSYVVSATQPGEYVLPAMTIAIGNAVVTTQPVTLKVQKTAAAGQNRYTFIKVIVPKTTVYLGEVFPVEIQLYALNPHDLNMPQLKADGFTVSQMPQPIQTQTQVGNTLYHVFVFKVAVTAAKAGSLSLGPVECNVVLRFRRQRDPSDILSDFLGGNYEARQFTATADAIPIEALPLPVDGRPDSFNGAVGNFTFDASASPTDLSAGDPITLRVQIAGSGNLDAVPFPPQNDWRDFKLYPPTSKSTNDVPGLSGSKTFEQVVIPQNGEVKALPSLSFSFFDPARKVYRTLQSPGIPLKVRASAGLQPQPTVLAGAQPNTNEPPPARDIVHIKPHLGTLTASRPALIQQPWFLALNILPIAAWIAALLWRRRLDALARNPRLLRRRQTGHVIRNGLAELSNLARHNQSDEFFALVFRLLQEQLGERLDLPASAITEAVLDDRLPQLGAGDSLIRQLHELFQRCNQARYAPVRGSAELMSIVPRVETALDQLQNLSTKEAVSR